MRTIKPTATRTIGTLAAILIVSLLSLPGCDEDSSTNSGSGPDFESGDLGQGETFSYTFDEEGTVDYYCEHHSPDMTGEIVVSSDAQTAETDTVEMANTQFQPSSLNVAPGTEVVWVNREAAVHTVTQGQPSTGGDDDDGGYDY